jgi:hypothetical protein
VYAKKWGASFEVELLKAFMIKCYLTTPVFLPAFMYIFSGDKKKPGDLQHRAF